jgi:hypothetical protein
MLLKTNDRDEKVRLQKQVADNICGMLLAARTDDNPETRDLIALTALGMVDMYAFIAKGVRLITLLINHSFLSEAVVVCLIKLGAMDTRLWRDRTYGYTLLHLLAGGAALTDAVMQAMLDRGIDLGVTSHRGATPLTVAVHYERWNNVRNLLRAGAPIDTGYQIYRDSSDLDACMRKMEILNSCIFDHIRQCEEDMRDSKADLARLMQRQQEQ